MVTLDQWNATYNPGVIFPHKQHFLTVFYSYVRETDLRHCFTYSWGLSERRAIQILQQILAVS